MDEVDLFPIDKLNVVMYKPEIPQNVGAVIRICACMGAVLHLIEPFGFTMANNNFLDKNKKIRASMDYKEKCTIIRHNCWTDFFDCFVIAKKKHYRQLIAFTPHSDLNITEIKPSITDVLIFGRESDGFSDESHSKMDILLNIPMEPNCRSMNVGTTIAMSLGVWKFL